MAKCLSAAHFFSLFSGHSVLSLKHGWRRSGGARVFAARGKRHCCRLHPHNQISNWYSYGYNDGISVDCEQYA